MSLGYCQLLSCLNLHLKGHIDLSTGIPPVIRITLNNLLKKKNKHLSTCPAACRLVHFHPGFQRLSVYAVNVQMCEWL